MTSFEDKSGKKRVIELTIGAAKRIIAKTGIDLVNPLEQIDGKSAFERIAENPLLLCDVLFELLCESGKTEESFAESLDGATMERGYKAFLEELQNFSLPRTREVLKRLITLTEETGAKQIELIKTVQVELGTPSGN